MGTEEPPTTDASDATLGDNTLGVDTQNQRAPKVARLEPGALIDRYVLLEKLGQGGMGVVWAAFDPQLERKVAVKLLLPERFGPQAIQRLAREAKALARLNHPNVVAVHDAGVHHHCVWIAMEHVDGHTVDAWLKLRTRSVQEILTLMILAGRGLAAAHAKGLVHRDFKPGNVMIGKDGRVRVMDFGLARTADRDEPREREPTLADSTTSLETMTATGITQGTPGYMAPEQFQPGAPGVKGSRTLGTTARTDQFAFCVTLWEALYGKRPFQAPTPYALAEAVTRGRIDPAPSKSGVPQWLRRVLERGLAVDPEQRWPSMEALLDRLERDPSRRRRSWACAAGLALALITGVGWQQIVDQREREAADRACVAVGQAILTDDWTTERQAAIEAAFVAVPLGYASDSFMRVQTELDRYAQRWASMQTQACRDRSGESLDRATACFHERRALFRSLVDLLAEADAAVVTRAIESVGRLPALEQCVDDRWLTSRAPPDSHAANPDFEPLRRRQARALAHGWTGAYQPAAEELRAIISEAETQGWVVPAIHARVLLGGMLEQLGHFEQAQAELERAFTRAIEHGRDELALEAAALLAGVTGQRLAKIDVGLAWATVAHAQVVRGGQVGDLEEAEVLNKRAIVLMRAAEWERASADLERSLALHEAALGPDHSSLVTVLNNLAGVHMQRGRLEQARPLVERMVTIQEATLGPEHVQLAATLNNLAAMQWTAGQLDQAAATFERALLLYEQGLGGEHPETLGALINLGLVQVQRGDIDRAEALSVRALAAIEGRESPRAARTRSLRGAVLRARGRHEEALVEHREALRSDRELLGEDHPQLAHWLTLVGEDLVALERFAEAREPLEQAIATHERARAPAHVIAHARLALAEVHWKVGDRSVADELANAALVGFAGSDTTRLEYERARALLELASSGDL